MINRCLWCKYSESRVQRQIRKQVFGFAMARRLLYSVNIVKAERRGKLKTQFSNMSMPRRLIYSLNIVKAERRDKSENKF